MEEKKIVKEIEKISSFNTKENIEDVLKNDEIRKKYNDEIDSLKIDSSLKYDRDDG